MSAARPICAGLKILKPRPPIDCFATMMASTEPMATIQGGRSGDIDIASSRPVMHALPSKAVTG